MTVKTKTGLTPKEFVITHAIQAVESLLSDLESPNGYDFSPNPYLGERLASDGERRLIAEQADRLLARLNEMARLQG